MADDIEQKAQQQKKLTNKMMQRARSKEAELYARMNALYTSHDHQPKRDCCKSLLASKRSGDSTPLTLIDEGDPANWDFKSTMQDIEHKLNTQERIPTFNFA